MNSDLERLKTDIAEGRVVAVVGTGVSVGASKDKRLASWTGFLESGLEHCRAADPSLDSGVAGRIREEIKSGNMVELLSAAGKISKILGAPKGGNFLRWLKETVGSLQASDPSVIRALADLGILLTTTNYDNLLETVTGLEPVTWLNHARVDDFLQGRERRVVLHLHGHWRTPESIILDYTSYGRHGSDSHAQNALHTLGTAKTLLFIGCGDGLTDPNFDQFLGWLREILGESTSHHFRLCCAEEENAVRQQHQANDRIRVICYGGTHSELAPFLRRLAPESSSSVLSNSPHTSASPRLPPPPYCPGRDAELHLLVTAVCSQLPAPIPVLGPAGIGKTTITVAAFYDDRVRQRFGERKFFAWCEGAMSSEGLLAEIAQALHLKPGLELETQVFRELEREPAFLVLDNLETPWERDQGPTEKLLEHLAASKHLALIVSLRGGHYPPGPCWREPIEVKPLDPSAAREAFLRVAGSRFRDDPNLDLLLGAMDRLPLAITLLAFQAQPESDLAALWKRWQHEKTKLLRRSGGGKRDIDLEVSLEISIKCLRMTADARRLLTLLGRLPDGIAPEDVEALLPRAGEAAAATLRGVGLTIRGETRSRMYTPVREYARSDYPPEGEDLNRCVDYFLALIQNGEAKGRLAPEAGNLEAMVIEALDRSDPVKGIDAALALAQFSFAIETCQTVLSEALKKARGIKDPNRIAGVLSRLGDVAMARSERESARAHFEEALLLFQEVDDAQGQAYCTRKLGDVAFRLSDPKSAQALYEKALPLARSVGDVLGEAYCELGLGEVALDRSDRETALTLFENALARFRCSAGGDLGAANCIRNLGVIALNRSDHFAARAYFGESLAAYRSIGEVMGEANCITDLGEIALTESDYETAACHFEEAAPLYRRLGALRGVANCIRKLGEIALLQKNYSVARTQLEEALRLYDKDTSVIGKAHCFRRLGDIAALQSRRAEAAGLYKKSLALFERIPNLELIGKLHEQLARVLRSKDEQFEHVRAAGRAWAEIGRWDLVQALNLKLDPPIPGPSEPEEPGKG
ncbi:MAG TPA: tetratricopeptide repeat protein [Thermoanaerobaculia bacterium]|nr:tetratricopeptide repeat protein [Thermoanaerobaculia bacterium]